MKLKLHLVCTDPERFLKGDTNTLTLVNHEHLPRDWIACGMIEVNVEVDHNQAIKIATQNLDEDIGKLQAAMTVLENRKKDLLCLDAPK